MWEFFAGATIFTRRDEIMKYRDEFAERGNTKKRKKVKLSGKGALKLAGILVAVGYVAVTLVHQQMELAEYKKYAREYEENKIPQAKVENQRLQDELEKADTDEYIEQRVRDEYGLVKPNERVFIDITQQ